jgi:hypothetical protein
VSGLTIEDNTFCSEYTFCAENTFWVEVSASTGRFHVHASSAGTAPLGSVRPEVLASCVRILHFALSRARTVPSDQAGRSLAAVKPHKSKRGGRAGGGRGEEGKEEAVIPRIQELLAPSLDLDVLVRHARLVRSVEVPAVEEEGAKEGEGCGGGVEEEEEEEEAAAETGKEWEREEGEREEGEEEIARIYGVLRLLHNFVADFRHLTPRRQRKLMGACVPVPLNSSSAVALTAPPLPSSPPCRHVFSKVSALICLPWMSL